MEYVHDGWLEEAFRCLSTKARGPSTSHTGENPTRTKANLTNLLLIELLQKQSDQLWRLSKNEETKDEEDSTNLQVVGQPSSTYLQRVNQPLSFWGVKLGCRETV